jgi:DNA invertase Pin-like site-specific DNA recombinase
MSETIQTAQKFFLYARKSTDVEDKQVLSIEAQLAELRNYAENENLEIVDELIEKQSAKVPGRPVFGELLRRIEQDEASGILAWHPDRLARNSIDGGQIVYLLDCEHLQALKFPTFWFENTSQGKFMLSIAFGQSKYYVDNLSENTKRGLRQKVRRGEYPSHAPVGYINDTSNKSIVVDKRRAPIIKQAFELYAKDDQRLEDIANFLAQKGIKTSGDKVLKKDRISFMLSNPFYYGHFRYMGEVYEGNHQPVISKKLFDSVQAVLERRSRPRKSKHNNPKAYCGLLSCAECHMAITAETQKGHVYYRCTRKSKTIKCTQPYVREEELDKQISSLLQTVSLKAAWSDELKVMLERDEQKSAQSSAAFVRETKDKIASLQNKLQRLLDSYLDQDIDRETYVNKKAELMSEKKSLEEQSSNLGQKQTGWLEPFKKWIDEASDLSQVAKSDDLFEKKAMSRKIFGSNLRLTGRRARHFAADGAPAPLEKHWTALRAARSDFGKIENSLLMAGERVHEWNFFQRQ